MRLIFIPGYGEEAFIFEKIHPRLEGEKLFIDNWSLVGEHPRYSFNALEYARELVERYAITAADVVIGHSMGGWIALHIKQLTGCRIIQIASWTDPKKLFRPVKSQSLVFGLVKTGIYHNPLILQLLRWKYYRHKPSAPVFTQVFKRLSRGNKQTVANQLRILFNPVREEQISVSPDLRIHARADHLVHFPDEPCIEVPGDHFTLYTHPDQVYQPIAHFLQQQKVVQA